MAVDYSISFGTSGLRGHANGFTDTAVASYVAAFLEEACAGARERAVWIGADLRASSPVIARRVAAAVAGSGWTPRYAGVAPTPAVAAFALRQGVPAIVVTGSHIPADYNGLKFYRPDGELLKSDEAPIRAAVEKGSMRLLGAKPDLPPPDRAVVAAYRKRYREAFVPGVLEGLRIGVFEHSAAGRDLIVEILEALGAECLRFGRSADFVAVDTEAVGPGAMSELRTALAAHDLDAVVSTDGDGDRPLVLDETGSQINGDVLGALTARALGARVVVTPLTSTSAIEKSGWFEKVVRTRIGSPYVVEAMAAEPMSAVGFEANGGFLVQSSFDLTGGRLDPLPTRDAILPMVAVLAAGAAGRRPLSALVADLPSRAMKADRLKDIAPDSGGAFVAGMAGNKEWRAAFARLLAETEAIDTTDGTRLTLADGSIVHFRQSGNAPELRCYVEADTIAAADAMLEMLMTRLNDYFDSTVER
ncbi:phosphomannomutase [Pelagibacterium limicola]|uniref:phosphomannomutase n=1 Tax=Pelagibacterium limicola TaxID=2791022 RepID=UPI0018AFD5A0|nr:phosphomannomutase [Pelagibacterium limicola]